MQKKISESSSYNLLAVYLIFAFSIFNTFIIARLLAPEEWAVIILIFSFVNIAIFFCSLFPPNAEDTMKYYIPSLSSNDNDINFKKRKFIFHVYKIRLLTSLLVFFTYLIISYLANFDEIIMRIILIMAPIILANILITLNTSVLFAFQKFKLVFIALVLSPIIVITCNISIFLLGFKNPIYLIAISYLLGSVIACILSTIIVIPLIPSKQNKVTELASYRKEFIDIHRKYGTYLIIANIFNQLSILIINLIFLNAGLIVLITYLTICQISVASALYFSSSNPKSYISIFSEINYEKNREYFNKLFYKLSIFLILLNCFIMALMLFYIELYIVVIYSEQYLIILYAIQLFLFTTFARVIIRNLMILSMSTKHTEINAIIAFIEMIVNVILTFIAILYFNFYILIIFFIISSYIMTLIMFIITKRNLDIKLGLIDFFKPFILFLFGFLITIYISNFFYIQISNKAYINFILNGTIRFSIFITIFYITIYFTKLITKEDFDQLVEIIPILNSEKKIIKILVNTTKKLLPSKKRLKS